MTKKSLIRGAAILGVAGLIVKFIGAFFRIPLAGLIGDVGMANYSPAYSLYAFLLVFSTTGLPVAISKMVSERYAVGQFREAERVFKLSRTLMVTLGVAGFCIIFFGADIIAQMVNVPGTALAMRATAPAMLFVPIMSSYRGYFQGMQEMGPTAVSQVVEQIFRVTAGLVLAFYLMENTLWITGYSGQERGAAGGCFGASAGAIGGLLIIVAIYFSVRTKIEKRVKNDANKTMESTGEILKNIAIIAIPITLGASIMPLVNLVDVAVVKHRLLASGWDSIAADALYGQLTGFAAPIIGFPQVFLLAIVESLVPAVSASNKLKDRVSLHNNISLGLRMTAIVAFPCSAGMFALAKPILLLLYPTQKASAVSVTPCLQALAISFIFTAIVMVLTGILQGIGKQTIPVTNLMISVCFKIAVTWILVAIPRINIIGATIGTICAYILAGFLDYRAVKKYTKVKPVFSTIVFKPMMSSIIMAVLVALVYKGVFALIGSNSLATLLSIFMGVIIYAIMIIKTKAIKREELIGVPIGRKIVKLCDKLKLW